MNEGHLYISVKFLLRVGAKIVNLDSEISIYSIIYSNLFQSHLSPRSVTIFAHKSNFSMNFVHACVCTPLQYASITAVA